MAAENDVIALKRFKKKILKVATTALFY